MKYIKAEQFQANFEITLNRAEKRNALNNQFINELISAFTEANNIKEVRTVVLKANGSVFSAGADLAYLQQLQSNSYEENLQDSSALKQLFELMYYHKKIIIAQVEGSAVAGGCGLVSACDFVFSVPEAKFGYTEVKIGFVPAIVMFFIMRKLGEAAARKLLLTGDLISAEKACILGLVTEVIPTEAIAAQVTRFTEKIAEETSPQSIELTRRMMADMQHLQPQQAFNYAAEQNAHARASEDCKKGIALFLEKKSLIWNT